MEDEAKISGLINLAIKGGYVVFGSETLRFYNKKLYLIIVDKERSKTTEKSLIALKSNYEGLEIVETETGWLSKILANKNVKIIGIRNKNFADIIKSKII